jgi:hypothetical protein
MLDKIRAPRHSPSADPAQFFPVALMHLPMHPALAPAVVRAFDAADDRSRAAAQRVVAAYLAATEAAQTAAPSMWAAIEGKQAAFLASARAGDLAAVQAQLARMFHTDLIWGLGRVHPLTPVHVLNGEPYGLQVQVTDALVSLAEATGAARVTNIEQQGVDAHLNALAVDPAALVTAIVDRTGLVLDMPAAGGNYGCAIAGHEVSIDSLVHAYTPYRLKQLGVAVSDRIIEIGGGYGCLSYVCSRNGFSDYTIVDLPWVNMLQGYLLIMTLGADAVSLYGEPDRAVKVRPFWEFFSLPDRSVDVVINTDSLPEIGSETARRYIDGIARVMRRFFLSINQEAMAHYPGVGPQQHVNGMVALEPRLRLRHRQRYWMRQGYVEEVFEPSERVHA